MMRKDTVLHYIRDYAMSQPDTLAVCELRKSMTYSQYWSNIKKVAAALLQLGVKEGTHVIIRNTQNIDYITTFTALQYMKAFPIPLEKSTTDERMVEIAADVDATVIISGNPIDNFHVIVLKELVKLAESLEEAELEMPKASDRSMLLYTTGTTGKSKGVIMRHLNDVAISENIIQGTEMKKHNVEIIPMPLNHSFATRRYQSDMVNGGTVCLMDGVVFIGTLWKMLDKYQATSMAIAPAALNVIFQLSEDRIGAYKDQIDYIQIGSAPLLEADKQRILSLLPNARLYNFYGSSEAGCSCILNFNSDDNKTGCIGKPTVNSYIRFVDEEGKEVAHTSEDQPALLSWGGPTVMEGYYKEPKLTAETLDHGYVRTNDIAYLDEEGRCILVGRADDVINFAGNKIAPGEVEECVLGFGQIADCAYSSVPDKLAGEAPVLLVVPKEGYVEAELTEYMAQKLEGYKLPKEILEVESLPRTFKGTLLRKDVKNMLLTMKGAE